MTLTQRLVQAFQMGDVSSFRAGIEELEELESGGGGNSTDSWFMAFTQSDSDEIGNNTGQTTLAFAGEEGVGDDFTLSEDGETVTVNSAGLYQITLDVSLRPGAGVPDNGILYVAPNVNNAPSPGYWADGNNGDGIPVTSVWAAIGGGPIGWHSAITKMVAGTTIQITPAYADTDDATTVKVHSGTGLYIVKIASLT